MSAHFTVRPRYSAGSPAMVSEAIALRVACQEREGYEAALSGIYGVPARERARRDGLAGIVLELVERRNAWHVYDLLMGAWQVWPFSVKCVECRRRVACRDGHAEEHGMPRCAVSGRYVGAVLPERDRWNPPKPEARP